MKFSPGTKVIATNCGTRHRVVACDCERCAAGKTVAVNEYLGRKYPCVFPGRGNQPTHFAARVITEDRRAEVERAARGKQLGLF